MDGLRLQQFGWSRKRTAKKSRALNTKYEIVWMWLNIKSDTMSALWMGCYKGTGVHQKKAKESLCGSACFCALKNRIYEICCKMTQHPACYLWVLVFTCRKQNVWWKSVTIHSRLDSCYAGDVFLLVRLWKYACNSCICFRKCHSVRHIKCTLCLISSPNLRSQISPPKQIKWFN